MSETTQAIEQEKSIQEPTSAPRRFEYKTTILYDNKVNEQIITVEPPQVNQIGVMHLLKVDRMVCINISKVIRWETEMLGEIVENKIITGEK